MWHILALAALLLASTATARADDASTCSIVAMYLPSLEKTQSDLIDRLDQATILEAHTFGASALPSIMEDVQRQRRDAAFQLVKFLLGYEDWLQRAMAAHCPQVGPDNYSRLLTSAQAFQDLAEKQVTR